MKTLTPEQIEQRDARHARFRELAQAIAAMPDDQRLELAARVHPTTIEGKALSMNNACLLATQFPAVTVVGGFNQWKSAGRSVRKGEHGLMIWAPKGRPNSSPAMIADLTVEPSTTDKPMFLAVYVFDVSQTDPIA